MGKGFEMTENEMLRTVTKALEDLSFECFCGVGRPAAPSLETYNSTFDALERARNFLAEFQPPKLWLWKNFVDGKPEYWAFDNPYPIHMDNGDPQTLGEPCGYAIFKQSRQGRTDVPEEQVLARIRAANAKEDHRGDAP